MIIKTLSSSLIVALAVFLLNENIVTVTEPEQIIKNEIEPENTIEITELNPESVSLGEYKLTAYCSCAMCCGKWAENRPDGKVVGAIGKELIAGYSIAVNPKVIPYGTVVIIDGKEYEAMDCGGSIKGNRIDIYFDDHNEALEFGVQYVEVFINED